MRPYQETGIILPPFTHPLSIDWVRPPETEGYKFVIAIDLEGPLVTTDTTLKTMALAGPKGYGAKLFQETYAWFEAEFDEKGMGQEGSDIVLTAPHLLTRGLTDTDLARQAATFRRTPGSEELINYLKSEGALVVAVTTAWQKPHRDIVLNTLGLDGIIGTEFSLDGARTRLIREGRYEREMEMTERYLSETIRIIAEKESANPERQEGLTKRLHQRIGDFFVGELGVSWNQNGRMISSHKTGLGEIMAGLNVVGDRGKAEATRMLFSQNFAPLGSPQIAVGDGYNDRRMLEQAPLSIAFNGAEAAKKADIAVISRGVGIIIPIIKLTLQYPEPTLENKREIVRIVRTNFCDHAIVTLGGKHVMPSDRNLGWHQLGRREVRKDASFFP